MAVSPDNFPRYNYDPPGEASPCTMSTPRHWIARSGAALVCLALLYPFTALLLGIGPWPVGDDVRGPAHRFRPRVTRAHRFCHADPCCRGAPVAAYMRAAPPANAYVAGCLAGPIFAATVALGILLTLAFGPYGTVGAALEHLGLRMTNTAAPSS